MSRFAWAVLLVAVVQFACGGEAGAGTDTYYGTRNVGGKAYHLYLHEYGGRAEFWCRVKKDASSTGDVKVAVMERKKQAIDGKLMLKDAAKAVCTVKKIYDGGKTVVGCGSVATSAVCLTASVPTGGFAAAFCSATLSYGIAGGGFVDCFVGVRDWVGSKLAGDSDWNLVATQVSISNAQFKNAILYTIDMACGKLK